MGVFKWRMYTVCLVVQNQVTSLRTKVIIYQTQIRAIIDYASEILGWSKE